MGDLATRDYFTDHEILKDPYGFFEAVRAHGPVWQPPGRNYYIVTGFAEVLEVLRNHEVFSAAIALQGAAAPLPFAPVGSDITAQLEAHRTRFLGWDQVVNLDDQPHTNLRGLMNTLFTPSRLKASEAFVGAYSDVLVNTAVAAGKVELIRTIATPFVTMVIADLLGVPEDDRQVFMEVLEHGPPPGDLDGTHDFDDANHPFRIMGGYFARYLQERMASPRADILTELAQAIYADGTRPEFKDLVQLGMFMFGAGQDTSAKLLGNAMKIIATEPALQDRLRADPAQVPAFLEEVLRIEGSSKQTARLARKDTTLGGIPIPAGTRLLVALSAANRDQAKWSDPHQLALCRPGIREHVAFGRGKHVCAGAPLARMEVRVILEKFLAQTSSITLDRDRHPEGLAGLAYEPSFIIRGLASLNLKLSPA